MCVLGEEHFTSPFFCVVEWWLGDGGDICSGLGGDFDSVSWMVGRGSLASFLSSC